MSLSCQHGGQSLCCSMHNVVARVLQSKVIQSILMLYVCICICVTVCVYVACDVVVCVYVVCGLVVYLTTCWRQVK